MRRYQADRDKPGSKRHVLVDANGFPLAFLAYPSGVKQYRYTTDGYMSAEYQFNPEYEEAPRMIARVPCPSAPASPSISPWSPP